MKKHLLSAAAAIGMAVSFGTAQAAPVTIVFQNPGADTPVAGNFTTGGTCNAVNVSGADLCTVDDTLGFDYSVSGVDLNVTAINGSGPTSLLQDLAPTNSGLAVLSPGEGSSDDQVQLSSNEALEFMFDMPVVLEAMDFNAGADRDCSNPGSEGPCGTFDLFVDGNFFSSYNAMDDMSFGSISGTVFRVVATGPLDGGFTVGSITVSQVPVPAAGLLLLSGLGGLSAVGRRRKAS